MGIQCTIYKCYISTKHKYLRKGPWNITTTLGVTAVLTDSVQSAQMVLGSVQQRGLSCNLINLNNARLQKAYCHVHEDTPLDITLNHFKSSQNFHILHPDD